jgi:dephospho-CoA kinase
VIAKEAVHGLPLSIAGAWKAGPFVRRLLQPSSMKLFGLTGGIASGKSTVAAMLRAAGVDVIDADQLARHAVARGLAAIVEAFGEGVLTADGDLDRPKLGAIVFHDDDKRRVLNSIVHPQVALLAAQQTQALREAGRPFMVYEVPLLFENGLDAGMDATVLVAVPEDVQRPRLMARDGLDEAAAQARIDSQMPLAHKRARATHVIDNSHDLQVTRAQLEAVWLALTGQPLAAA